MSSDRFIIGGELVNATLAAVLKKRLAGPSWAQVRRLVETRRVRVGGELCLDAARRLKEGEQVELLERPAAKPLEREAIVLRHVDEHVVVVEKPAGLCTVRHPAERDWPVRRKQLQPALADLLPALIARHERHGGRRQGPPPRLRVVHRLDKETSGLLVFARTVTAERELGRQFHRHSVTRRYLAIVPGRLTSQRLASRLVRDRGDGRRGSTSLPEAGKPAITHVDVIEELPGHTLVSCRLETGRTHQIRIHLAELGHPICGEKVYQEAADAGDAPRLALHAAELGFLHPVTHAPMHWSMPLPADLASFLSRLGGSKLP